MPTGSFFIHFNLSSTLPVVKNRHPNEIHIKIQLGIAAPRPIKSCNDFILTTKIDRRYKKRLQNKIVATILSDATMSLLCERFTRLLFRVLKYPAPETTQFLAKQ